ncbi:hypothetical protein [Adhaeribacter pallidiroseus]|uniref:Uncharacterized protein n=1 Tax=Adhaeribacter pallidiroseus TaxID=2072847 RepID=A0A369QC49_9BACT|nr:hypothetical protein [Adhaeribacter pallidiroseus]RDC62473.1 hypothetical protein AHMF7616_01067 [Adhaeribacter pallidiroseus]
MAEKIITQLKFPATVTAWNRIEGRPRTEDFDRALKAEVRDALWMVSRQWQLGEFIGDDAGSPVFAKVHMKTTALTKYQPQAGNTQAMPSSVPLEVKVENQPIPFKLAKEIASLDIRLLMGRQWFKLLGVENLAADTLAAAKSDFVTQYAIARPDPENVDDAALCAHPQVWQQFAAVAGRRMDGYELYQYLKKSSTNHASDNISSLTDATDQTNVDDLAKRFIKWYEQLYYQPLAQENPSWKPSHLEHQFACSAPQGATEKVLIADEYYHGHLDWYNLDINPEQTPLGTVEETIPDVEQATTLTFIPSGITFAGMPHTRWWQFEHSKTNFGDIKPDTTDLNKLMLLDFGLMYANDWFMVPFTLPVGSIADVAGLSVTDVFGERFWIEAAGSGSDEDWQRWNMFSLSIRGSQDVPADNSLVLLPAAPKLLEAKPMEQIYLLRDEVANMVWGVEAQVPLATGKNKPGKEAALELKAKYQQFIPPVKQPLPLENDGSIRYQVVNSVPEHWIPFVPVHLPDSNRQIQLQRAAMPRILEGDPNLPKKVEPRTSILRQGLDSDSPKPYFLHEEEVTRAGTLISKAFQRTRWYNGRVFTWVGMRKQSGRGEGFSGLAFDQIFPKEKQSGV